MLLNKMKTIQKVKNRMFMIGLILFILVLMNFVSAQTCNVSKMGDVLKKSLNEYLPAPELSKLNPQEIKDLLEFYLNSSNFTTIQCDMKSVTANVTYDILVNKFENLTSDYVAPYCDSGTRTLYGECSKIKPKYCFSGKLYDWCEICGCPSGQKCQVDTTLAYVKYQSRGKCVPIDKNHPETSVINLGDIDGDGIDDTLTGIGVNVGRWGTNVSIYNNIIAFSSYERYYTVGDLNGDGDTDDVIIRYYDFSTGNLVNPGIEGWFDLDLSNNVIAFTKVVKDLSYYNINNNDLIDTGIDSPQSIAISNNIIAFSTYEGYPYYGDLNGDGDQGDVILRYYDIYKGNIVNTGIVVVNPYYGYGDAKIVISDNIIAFALPDQSLMYYDILTDNLVNTNLSGRWFDDLVISGNIIAFTNYDRILKYYDLSTNKLVNTSINITWGGKLAVSNGIIAISDSNKKTLLYYDIATKKLVNTNVSVANIGSLSSGVDISNGIITFLINETQFGKDLTGNGLSNDTILGYLKLSKYKNIETQQDISCNQGCSARKPRYCSNRKIIDNCQACGCPNNQTCQSNGSCVAVTCSNSGGDICTTGEYCPGTSLDVTDTNQCCSKTCTVPQWNLCNECGSGLFNTCNSEECDSISEGCYFLRYLVGGSCYACSGINSCESYDIDQLTCSKNPCHVGNCLWTGQKCITCSCPNGKTCLANGSCPSSLTYKIVKQFSSPQLESSGAGIVHTGMDLFFSDAIASYQNKIYKLNPENGDVRSSYTVSSGWNAHGMAYDGDILYFFEYSYGRIKKFDPNTMEVIGAIAAPADYIHDLTYDGENLWAIRCGPFSGFNVYKLNKIDGSVLGSFTTPTNARCASGIAWDGNNIWISEQSTKSIYKIDQEVALATQRGSDGILETYAWPFTGALDWEGNLIWTISEDMHKILLINLTNITEDCDGHDLACMCLDGTLYGECSITKPIYCDNGTLINKCSTCGCSNGKFCFANERCEISFCSDGTLNGSCSTNKPFYCQNKTLVQSCSQCGCPNGESCLINGSCEIPKCQDGTLYNNCSQTKPLYCNNGNLIIDCSLCGCSAGNSCRLNGSCAPTCSDSTFYGNCSTTKPLYCNGALVNSCSTCGCSNGKTCLVNGSCEISKCQDGTLYNNCSQTKPLYCNNGNLIIDCSLCGCSAGNSCHLNGSCAPTCSDGTFYGSCSPTKPLYCNKGTLITKCSTCGCSEGNACAANSSCVPTCSDGTVYGNCSLTKPLYCDNGILNDNCKLCGCSNGQKCKPNGDCTQSADTPNSSGSPTGAVIGLFFLRVIFLILGINI